MQLSEIGCGTISAFGKEKDANDNPTTCTIAPLLQKDVITPEFSIQFWLRGNFGKLEVGTEVLYIQFADGSGTVIARKDGNWEGIIPDELTTEKGLTVTKDVTINGNLTVIGETSIDGTTTLNGENKLIGNTKIDGSLEITKTTTSGSQALAGCPGGVCPVSGIKTATNKTM